MNLSNAETVAEYIEPVRIRTD